ncbi:hypothetical protein [uncultured Desulfobacter sp.]|uniref:hypothetical protein n=1 Tax=uncultured Desulfobacter sp. TaxID=240139 RepID=UPI002AABA75D|nr:hypothetical protein [uncultured Desulfobacter sp.]
MHSFFLKMFYDKRDHDLISVVNSIHDSADSRALARKWYYPAFHPNGIRIMTEPRGIRAAYAVAHLLNSLEEGDVEDRIMALRLLRAEVLDTATGPMPKNTARVLLQLMKELIRAKGDQERQLSLAHDFRMAAFGKPLTIRRHLKEFRLLEMPEEWNQIAFDDHVHDANTKGRKTPTHLVMDAWIKGIRRLRVVQYHYIEPRIAAELFSAAKILEIDVRMGVEYYARYRNKYVQLVWVPRGFSDTQDYLCFLAEPAVVNMMEMGRAVSRHIRDEVMALLDRFNSEILHNINADLELEMPALSRGQFLKFVGVGQASVGHLSEFIQTQIEEALGLKLVSLKNNLDPADEQGRRKIQTWIDQADRFDIEDMVESFLASDRNQDILLPKSPQDNENLPELMRLSAPELLDRVTALRSGYRVTLNLVNLRADEVLELLYDGHGMITRLEIFNLKAYMQGDMAHLPAINTLQQTLNSGSIISLKHEVRDIISETTQYNDTDAKDRQIRLEAILNDLMTLKLYYQDTPLKSRIGSDSTGRTQKSYGMGLAVKETLPLRAQREIHHSAGHDTRRTLPLRMSVFPSKTYIPYHKDTPLHPLIYRMAYYIPGFHRLGFHMKLKWLVYSGATHMNDNGNIVTLGGLRSKQKLKLSLSDKVQKKGSRRFGWHYLDSRLKNILKVLGGLIPAFFTFALTKDFWVLAYLGAFIWFGITGVRNIIQSVLGGGGFKRSPMLRWNDYVSWDRLTDSLLFTGFSVPLLDYLVKTVALDRGFDITTTTHPVWLYVFMALANGLYLFTHNTFRGLPKVVAFGNLFRSILSIPVAIALNAVLFSILPVAGVLDANIVLQKWAAVISKASSDIVAGLLEGFVDRVTNIRLRIRDYSQKFGQILESYTKLELLFPDMKTFAVLSAPKDQKNKALAEVMELENILMLHALDLLYFWMYQPRATSGLEKFIASLSEDERHVFITSQFVLQRNREISQLFIDGILGDNFPAPLSFYLSCYPAYLKEIKKQGFT